MSTLDTSLLNPEPSSSRLLTDLRRANELLVIASLEASSREDRAKQAQKKQSLFLSMLAHELRNPLAPISMSVELLARMGSASPEIQGLQRILARQTKHLTRLVEDLMDATRIESGKITVHRTTILLSQLLEQAVETSQPVLSTHRQPVELRLTEEPVWLDGDLVRLSQLFSNLIINASKFSTDFSPITISAQRDAGKVFISVKDEGFGIAPEHQPFIFDLFTQGPAEAGGLTSGLGIGLSLVQTIAHLHGGTVAVVSEGVGRGSEFIVTLPVISQTSNA